MVYSIFFLYVVLYSYLVRVKENKIISFTITYAPVFILFLLLLSLQYNVGTDYFSYLNFAEGSKDARIFGESNEFLFMNLVLIVNEIGIPQLIFCFAAIIQLVFFTLITYEVKKMGYSLHIFFFLFFTLSLVFFNQFNGIRQYIAVYIIIYAIIRLSDNKKLLFILLVGLASLFHSSALFLLPLIFINNLLKKNISIKLVITVVGIMLIASTFDLMGLYEKVLLYSNYSYYIGSEYFTSMSIEGIITKIPKLLIVILSAYLLNNERMNNKERYFINLAYLAVIIQILTYSATLIWRFYQYFDLFIVFPTLFLIHKKNNRIVIWTIYVVLIVMLALKILVIPQGEYAYKSIINY